MNFERKRKFELFFCETGKVVSVKFRRGRRVSAHVLVYYRRVGIFFVLNILTDLNLPSGQLNSGLESAVDAAEYRT